MQHRRISGRIAYTSRKPEMMGKPRGFETFSFTHHGDGSVIMTAHCEIEEPAPTVMRDIVYAMGPGRRPRNLHVHLTVGDAFMGSGWINASETPEGGRLECESNSPSLGRISQVVDYKGHIDGFGTHPIVGDAFISLALNLSKGPHKHNLRVFLPSPDHRGATPPLLAEVNITLEYVGDETVTVQAGTFQCRHFRFIDESAGGMGGKEHPQYDIWVTADDDAIFVQGGVGGYMQTWYELVELER